MPTKHIKLTLTPNGLDCQLEIDGVIERNARSVSVHAGVGGVPTVCVEYVNVAVEIEGEAEVQDVTGLADKIRRFERS